MTRSRASIWDDACLGACLCAVAPQSLGGIALRAGSGAVRDQWMHGLMGLLPAGMPFRRVPLYVSDARLLGGLDLCATLAAGRAIGESGILQQAHGGLLVLAMAERLTTSAAARYMGVIDTQRVVLERDGLSSSYASEIGVIALDESEDGESGPAAGLKDRLALHLDLRALSNRDLSEFPWNAADVARAAELFFAVQIDDAMLHTLCATALALGIESIRAPLLACRTARALAALQGRLHVDEGDVACAARLVLAPRATMRPPEDISSSDQCPAQRNQQPPEQHQEQLAEQPDPVLGKDRRQDNQAQPELSERDQPGPDQQATSSAADDAAGQQTKVAAPPQDAVLAAAVAALPEGLLAQLRPGVTPRAGSRTVGATGGRFGVAKENLVRGRPVGSRSGDLSGQARLHLLATLRAAAPWQALRRQERLNRASAQMETAGLNVPRVQIRRQDFAIRRFVQRAQTTTIFVVDASGSSALHRLAEAKGAVEQLLAECYIRRDRVAVLGFRHQSAELLLPPTRSLVRAKRSLAAMPANGGTPLAAAIDAGAALADSVRRHGDTPFIVLLSDGRANVARDGSHDRARARQDALSAGGALRAAQLTAIFVDTSPRSNIEAHHVADSMGAQYVALPYADSSSLCSVIKTAMV